MPDIKQLNKRLQRAPATVQGAASSRCLTFTLGGETFAMEIEHIREVIQYGGLTVVPLMPDFLRGVLNLRGAVVPVVDLSVRFRRPPTEVRDRSCIVILEVGEAGRAVALGVLVDNVSEVLEIPLDQVEPAPAFGGDVRSEFIRGIAKVAGRFVILLDVNRVVDMEELSAITGCQEVAGEA